ncbi:RNA methyltransferase [Desulfuromonas sp. AOP6]|uniref:RNA methyltransferase n=1 Tax=Desulfuromonas sp. AOP6 TaxID=1566351 RepID=UPI0012843F1E|nr:RNA methyltransferase [Desulfuromonas sp. AOP6]BCA78348.1 tRNA (cytidine/uridine-2'-O-)-methyltransferase TrmJ [Desulfuromonas sp. AOP6]
MNISLAHISVILVEPQSPGNIGMVCRAMANFGCKDLRLVNPCLHLHPEARKFAVAANHLLGEARLFPSLTAAIDDLTLSVATTRRPGRLRGDLLDISKVPTLQQKLPPEGRLGLIFGREDSGLTSDEVALCSHAASVETSLELGSLNLAQAVILFLYELSRTPKTSSSTIMAPTPRQGEMEELFGQVESILTRIAFLNPARPEAVMNRIRQLMHRAAPSQDDLSLLRGLCSQLSWSLRDWKGRKRGSS